jgi:hypothetical protein
MARIARARPKFVWVHKASGASKKSETSRRKAIPSTRRCPRGNSASNRPKRDSELDELRPLHSSSRQPLSASADGGDQVSVVPTIEAGQSGPNAKSSTTTRGSSDPSHAGSAQGPRPSLAKTASELIFSIIEALGSESLTSEVNSSRPHQPEFETPCTTSDTQATRMPQRHGELQSQIGSSPLPKPMLLCGNSDPFQSTALTISPEINRVLSFMRDAILPAIYSTDILRQWSPDPSSRINLLALPSIISFQAANGDWQQQVAFLHDEGMALAGLSAWTHLLPELKTPQRMTGAFPVDASLMRARSCALLCSRLQLERDLRSLSKDTVLHIFWLFRSEAISGSSKAACIHGDRLRVIVKHAYSSGTIGIQSLIQFLFVDVDLATACMERTMFDIDWFVEVLKPLWLKGRSSLPSIDRQVQLGLSSMVEMQVLVSQMTNSFELFSKLEHRALSECSSHCRWQREVMTENRLYIDLGRRPFSIQDCYKGGCGEVVYAYTASCSLVDLGRLVNLYQDLISDHGAYSAGMSLGRRYTQACLVLAAMFVIRSIGHSAMVMGKDIRDRSRVIMVHLRRCLPQAFCYTASEGLRYAEAHVWSAYVGALYEKRLEFNGQGHSETRSAFQEMLAHKAHAMGITTWVQMQAIEQKFLQTDLLYPHGDIWFEDVLTRA